MSEHICIKIHRFDPETDSRGRLEMYRIEKSPSMRVLSAVSSLNAAGANIAIRYYCEEFHCGSCAVRIDGVPKLACKTEVMDGMTIEPLADFPLIKDLLVDRSEQQALHRVLDCVPEQPTGSALDYDNATRLWKSIICIRCGICLASCPVLHCRGDAYSYIGPEFMLSLFRSEFDPRIEKSSMAIATQKGIWECTLCGHCKENCPQSIPIPELILMLRKKTIENKATLVPFSIRDLNERLLNTHNPFGRERKERTDWERGLLFPPINQTAEALLYLVGCDQCYSPRDQVVARAMVDVFNRTGIEFATLGADEVSAGDPAFITGNMRLFSALAAINIENFKKHGSPRIVTTSPHDYSLIKNEYPALGGVFSVVHYTQLFEELILSGKIKLKNAVEKTVAFHDPCFLGRYHDMYEPPRNILKAIPGLKLVEIFPNRQQAECCGGGGGGNWIDLPAGERVSERRLKQAIETGAEIIAVACPHCLFMFEEAIKTLGCEGQVEIKQVIELVQQAI